MSKRSRIMSDSKLISEGSSQAVYDDLRRLWTQGREQEAIELCSKGGDISKALVQELLENAKADQESFQRLVHTLTDQIAPACSIDFSQTPTSRCEPTDGSPSHVSVLPASATNLPGELLIKIFEDVSFEDKVVCLAICQRWNKLLTNEPRLWADDPLLKGTLDRVDAQFKRLSVLLQGQEIRSLRLEFAKVSLPEENYKGVPTLRYFSTLQLMKFFPYHTLESFEYTGSKEELVNEQIWALVVQCGHLKDLYWDVGLLPYYKKEPFVYEIANTPLAQCHLRAFSIRAHHNCRLDKLFTEVLNQAKIIDLDALLQYWRVRRILVAARETLEDLRVCEVISHPNELEAARMDPRKGDEFGPIHMPELRTYETTLTSIDSVAEVTEGVQYHIIAPKVIDMCINGWAMMDHTMLKSCHFSLISLSCAALELNHSIEERQFLCMPQLENLSVYNCPQQVRWIPATGDRLSHDDTTIGHEIKLDQVFPKLKTLELAHDTEITGEQLVNWITYRTSTGNHSLQEMILPYCPKIDPQAVAKLKKLVPTCFHSRNLPIYPPMRRRQRSGEEDVNDGDVYMGDEDGF